jgi:hypothetical protein
MKKIITLFIAAIPFLGTSQLTANLFSNNGTLPAVELYTLPYDTDRLVQLVQTDMNVNLPIGNYNHEIFEIIGGVQQPFIIPLCQNLIKPTFLEHGILTGGEYLSGDQELIYWDGSNVTSIELNNYGNSNPLVYRLKDEVYVLATDSANVELYRFNESTVSIEKLTDFDSIDVVSVIANQNGDVYFSTQHVENTSYISKLYKSFFNGTDYQTELIREETPQLMSDYDVFWFSPATLSGELYMIERYSNLQGFPTYGYEDVIHIDGVQINGIHHHDYLTGYTSGKLFNWNNKLMYFQGTDVELYSTTTNSIMTVEAQVSTGNLGDYYVSENERLFFIRNLPPTDLSDFIEYENGNFVQRSGGNHLHILNEFDHKLFIYDWHFTDSSKIRVFDTQWNNLDSASILPAPHSMVENSSLMYQGKFTFLYNFFIPDVFQLSGDVLSISDIEVMEEKVFPNPALSNETLVIQSAMNQEVYLLSSTGQMVKQYEISSGDNVLELNGVAAGSYILQTETKSHKIIIVD